MPQVVLYSAQQHEEEGNAPRLAISFENQSERDKIGHLCSDRELRVSTVPGNDKVLYIEPSRGPGETGTYVSGQGELSVAFKNRGDRDLFTHALGIDAKEGVTTGGIGDAHALAVVQGTGSNALYFNPAQLPPQPDRARNITTVAPPDYTAYERFINTATLFGLGEGKWGVSLHDTQEPGPSGINNGPKKGRKL